LKGNAKRTWEMVITLTRSSRVITLIRAFCATEIRIEGKL
jgi:hypothetical protein